MRWIAGSRSVVAGLVAVASLAGCKGEDPSNFSITASSDAVTMLQGSNQSVVLTITRLNFTADVNLVLEGTLPAGVSSSFSQNPVDADQPTTALAFQVSASAAPGTTNLTVKATAEGAPEQTLPVSLTISVRGTHTLSLASATMTIAQGGGGATTLLVNRVDANAGSVTLAVNSPPAGITATFGQSPTTSASTSLIVSAAASVAPGSYTLTFTGAQAGVSPTPQTSLTLTVVAPEPTADVTLAFCPGGEPNWFAYQNEGFNWKQAQPSGNLFTIAATNKVGVAFAYVIGNSSVVSVLYATRAELDAGFNEVGCFGERTLTGTTANVSASQTAVVGMGLSSVIPSNNAFSLSFLRSVPLDLIAIRGIVSNSLLTPEKVIVRRAIATASGSLPVIDFQAVEALPPSMNTVTITGLGSDLLFTFTDFWGATHSPVPLYSNVLTNVPFTTYGAPASAIVAGDLHELYVETIAQDPTLYRAAHAYFSAPADRTIALPPTLNAPTVSTVSTSPFVRLRGQLESQSAYGNVARFRFGQGSAGASKEVRVEMTAAFAGGMPATWDLSIPDMSAASGFNAGWMLTTGSTVYHSVAFGGKPEVIFGVTPTLVGTGVGVLPVAGDFVTEGFRAAQINVTATSVVGGALRASSKVAPTLGTRRVPAQYFRR